MNFPPTSRPVLVTTLTMVSRNSRDVKIHTEYLPSGASLLYCFIAEEQGAVGDTPFIEGEGVFAGVRSGMNFYVNQGGELIITDWLADPERFSLESGTGMLKEKL